MHRTPDVVELRDFLHRMVAEARLMEDWLRVDALLDKLSDVDGLHVFIDCAMRLHNEGSP